LGIYGKFFASFADYFATFAVQGFDFVNVKLFTAKCAKAYRKGRKEN